MQLRKPRLMAVYGWLAIITLLSLGAGGAGAAPIVLAEAGQTDYQIVLPAEVDVSTQAVAEDFAEILQQITGATFPIVTDQEPPAAREIIIGASNSRLAALGLAEMTKDFAQGEYEIRTVGDHLVIAGGPPRGTINGMYGLLQDHLGCRWFTPGVSRIPEQATLSLPNIQDRQCPAFQWRSTSPVMHWDAGWTVRNRLNECKAYGGTVSMMMLMSDPRAQTIGNYSSAHEFSYIPTSLFEEHPEYYAMINGERRCHDSANQRAYCVTNEGFVKYMADRLKRYLRGTTGPRFVGLGHADNANFCQCEECRASYDRIGLAGTYMEFDNKVAAEVAKEYPEAIICTLGYGITFDSPPFKMHPNIRVIWCPISACYAHGFDECQHNLDRDYRGRLADWQSKTSQLAIWYYHHQADVLMPHVNLFATQRNFKIFQQMRVQGIFVEDTPDATRRNNPVPDGDKLMPAYGNAERQGYFTVPWGLEHLKSYITCRLQWNPNFNIKAGIRDFCRTYYGPAAEEMTRYAIMVESIDSYEKTMTPAKTQYSGVHQDGSLAPMLKWPVIEQMDDLFDRAAARVADDEILLRRVQMARLSLQLEILCFASADSPLRQKAFDGFFPLMEELGIKRLYRTGATMNSMTVEEFKELMMEPEKIAIPGEERVGENILANSDFETDADGNGIPDGWSAEGEYLPEGYTLVPEGVTLDTTRARSGERSVKLTKSPAKTSIVALRQRFLVKPEERYRTSVYYQADFHKGGPHIIFTAFDEEGKWLRHQGGARGVNSTGDQWRELSVDTKVEDDTAELMIEFLFYDDQAEGVAWIDDFTCGKIQKD